MGTAAGARLGLVELDTGAAPAEQVLGDRTARRVITAADVVLTGYCLVSLSVALRAYWRNEAGGGGAVAIAALLAGNVLLSVQPLRWRRPLQVELARAAMGAVLAPVAYLTTTKPFGHWW